MLLPRCKLCKPGGDVANHGRAARIDNDQLRGVALQPICHLCRGRDAGIAPADGGWPWPRAPQLAAGWLQQAQIDRTVMVNNSLFTHLYPVLQAAEIDACTALGWPTSRSTLCFGVGGWAGESRLVGAVTGARLSPTFSRQIYYQDARNPELLRKKQVKIDLAEAAQSDLPPAHTRGDPAGGAAETQSALRRPLSPQILVS